MAPSPSKKSKNVATSGSSSSSELIAMVWLSVAAYAVYIVARAAYRIRMFAIEEYGPVIHEFDPYFNYRATEVSAKPQTVHASTGFDLCAHRPIESAVSLLEWS